MIEVWNFNSIFASYRRAARPITLIGFQKIVLGFDFLSKGFQPLVYQVLHQNKGLKPLGEKPQLVPNLFRKPARSLAWNLIMKVNKREVL